MATFFAAVVFLFASSWLPNSALANPKVDPNVPASSIPNAKPVANNVDAPIGGTFAQILTGEIENLHPINSTSYNASVIQGYVLDSLLSRDPNTYEWVPAMAERYEISKDGKIFTFWLRKGMKFHDGSPVEAADAKLAFDAIFDPAYEAGHLRPYFEGIARVEVVDSLTIRVHTRNSYFMNFNVAASIQPMPRSAYGDPQKSKKLTQDLIGAGPYRLSRFSRGDRVVLTRNPDWYGFGVDRFKGTHNFQTLVFRIVPQEAVALEMLKKGDLGFLDLSPEQFVKQTQGDPWGKTVTKHRVKNYIPVGYGYVGWNLTNPIFQDRKVRQALAHLMNREEINQKIHFGFQELARGPVYNWHPAAGSSVKAMGFDPKKAKQLLAEAGWTDSAKKGVLRKRFGKEEREFRFTITYGNKDVWERTLTQYQEDLRKAGIVVELKFLEWSTFLSVIRDPTKFEAVALRWAGGSYDWDPKQIWHSASIGGGGSNFISYRNKEVDQLIDKARLELNEKKRTAMLRKVYQIIADDAPYAFLFNSPTTQYGKSAQIGFPAETYPFWINSASWWRMK